MRAFVVALAVFAGISCFTLWALIQPETYHLLHNDHANTPQRARNIDNGRLIFAIGGCASCHASIGAQDRTMLGGGLELATSFGRFYPPNISSDKDYGLGEWSENDFIRALREGVSPRGEHYYPAFPYTSYRHMNADDIADLFAYLKTLPPVQGQQSQHDLQFPYNLRPFLGLWKLAFFTGNVIMPDATHDAIWNRGRYLVEGPGHCAECHSPRAFTGAIIDTMRFSGGMDAEGKGWVPNITTDASGIGSWSREEIAELLKTGFTPDYDSVGGSMTEVVKNTSQLSDDDRLAMATYLKSLPAIVHKKDKK